MCELGERVRSTTSFQRQSLRTPEHSSLPQPNNQTVPTDW
ncbi:hypothetical protein CLIM01_15154 [Colletotrichum limetticola]|uniref:Uncharacterized protein n=1 Tax=Colletotrichum limetticola TaxID=1209924 RepID=A0ABQ9P5W5_9PEZI|nr:hypothetical protein CLIM01_15154 [Colletotrichum limetticola]